MLFCTGITWFLRISGFLFHRQPSIRIKLMFSLFGASTSRACFLFLFFLGRASFSGEGFFGRRLLNWVLSTSFSNFELIPYFSQEDLVFELSWNRLRTETSSKGNLIFGRKPHFRRKTKFQNWAGGTVFERRPNFRRRNSFLNWTETPFSNKNLTFELGCYSAAPVISSYHSPCSSTQPSFFFIFSFYFKNTPLEVMTVSERSEKRLMCT